MDDLLRTAQDAYRGLQSWGRITLLNPAQYIHDPVVYSAASRAKYAAHDLGTLLLMDADRIRRGLKEGSDWARDVVEWAWRVHRLAIEWGLPVNEEAVDLMKKLKKEVNEGGH